MGLAAWAVIERCAGQIRIGPGGPYGLDFGAVFTMAEAMGAMSPLLADVLPSVEPIILNAWRTEEGE